MFRAPINPSSGVSQAVFYIQPFGSCVVYVAHLHVPADWSVMVVSLKPPKPPQQTSPQAHADEQHKHCMNQMVVHKKQLEIPLMMGLWEPETCRVKKEINTQNKELHPLVTLLQYVQKMHGMNNLKIMFHIHLYNFLVNLPGLLRNPLGCEDRPLSVYPCHLRLS